MMTKVTRIFDLLQTDSLRYSSGRPVFSIKHKGVLIKVDFQTYRRNSYTLAHALMESGIMPGDRVATLIKNRPEWNFADMAISLIGAIQVPVYPTISEHHLRLIFQDADIAGLIVNDDLLWTGIKPLLSETPSLKIVIAVEPVPGLISMDQLLAKYGSFYPEKMVVDMAAGVAPDNLASIIYTSGTTGRPKGVMLSHSNMVSNFTALTGILGQQPASKAASILPLCHIYERILNYTYQNAGTTIGYIDGFDHLREDLAETKPEIFCAVPRIIEKLFDAIMARGRNLKGIRRLIFHRAITIGQQFEPGATFTLGYRLQLALARRLVFSKWHAALGGNLATIVSGGASLNPRIARIFWSAGFRIMEGYGLTETSPVVAVSNFLADGVRIGTVGPVLPGVEIQFAPDGEILVRGPNVMMGYYKRPELTAEVIDIHGWFHTGDIGHLLGNKFLQITDRKKEIFKTSGGKYIAPQVMENRFKESAFIEHIMVIGENRKHPAALIIPDFEYLKGWCRVKEIPFTTNSNMIHHARVVRRIGEEMYAINQHFGHHEQIKKWEFVPDRWSAETGELSPTLKLRRKFLHEKYYSLIEEMYKTT